MGSKKLVWCCIAGIVLGYAAPFVMNVNRSTSLSIGMVAGLGIGYLLDILDEKKENSAGNEELSKKAQEASRLIEKARAEVTDSAIVKDTDSDSDVEEVYAINTDSDEESDLEEDAEKLNQAEELLRKARERMN